MLPLIITVAAVGAELSLDQQPNLPITPEAVAADAAECRAAGASIYHLHVRDERGMPTMDVERFRAVTEAIARTTDVIVQFTTGGAVTDSAEARVAPLDLRPEMATLTTGSVNFGEEIFANPLPFVRGLYERMLTNDVLPEFEIFEPGMIATADRLYAELGARHHRHFDLVLGVAGAMPAWPDAVEFLSAHLPDGCTWSATGIGKAHEAVTAAALDLGGHVRTGFEDVLYIGPGRKAPANAALVEKVVEEARGRGRQVAAPADAREILGLHR